MTTVILSLGQFISSNIQVLKNSFEQSLDKDGLAFAGDEVWHWVTLPINFTTIKFTLLFLDQRLFKTYW